MSVDDWRSTAAANNAEWCDLVCRSHGADTTLDGQAWTTRTRSPRFYPDAVTLTPDVFVEALLARIDDSAGCSVKDSFASLDLSAHGFRVLFEAQWIISGVLPAAPAGGLRWEVVRSRDGLAEWEAAWGNGGTDLGLFRAELLGHDSVAVLGGRRDGDLVAGAVLNSSTRVVGISNFFAVPADAGQEHAAAARSDCIAYAESVRPGTRFCGYESGSELVDALRTGFEEVGPLRVWIRDE